MKRECGTCVCCEEYVERLYPCHLLAEGPVMLCGRCRRIAREIYPRGLYSKDPLTLPRLREHAGIGGRRGT